MPFVQSPEFCSLKVLFISLFSFLSNKMNPWYLFSVMGYWMVYSFFFAHKSCVYCFTETVLKYRNISHLSCSSTAHISYLRALFPFLLTVVVWFSSLKICWWLALLVCLSENKMCMKSWELCAEYVVFSCYYFKIMQYNK